MRTVYVIVPDGFDDPARPSGGNVYDREVCHRLDGLGWSVQVRAVSGSWPCPEVAARSAVANAVAAIPDDAVVLLDGLIASTLPEVLVPEAGRVREVVLVHMPLEQAQERAVLAAASGIVATSEWTRGRLHDLYGLRAQVAAPGVDAADLAPGTATGGELLCVATVAPHKGHDVLLQALAAIPELSWRCTCVGPLDREFAARLDRQAVAEGINGRVHYSGPLAGADLQLAYARADVLVLASYAETYGMVVTEALARGLPVIATCVGGVPEAFGPSGCGLLVPPGDPAALAEALRRWLQDAALRRQLRNAASVRRETLSDWWVTARRISDVLSEVAA